MNFIKTLVEKNNFNPIVKINNMWAIHLLPENSADYEDCYICWECLVNEEPNEEYIDTITEELNVYINKLTTLLEIAKAQQDIKELKKLLANSDYKAIKYAEGVISEEEYLPIKEERQTWRNLINEKEEYIISLQK